METVTQKDIKDTNLIIILDNGGGYTLQVPSEYQHSYNNASQIAEDITTYLHDQSINTWEGNELCICDDRDINDYGQCNNCERYEELNPSNDDIRNGGYHICSSNQDVINCANNGWGNAINLCKALNLAYDRD